MKKTFKLMQQYIDALNAEPEKRDTWIFALKSGDFKQCAAKLYKEKDVAFCCMGVGQYVLGDFEFSDLVGFNFPEELLSKEVKFGEYPMSSFRTNSCTDLATLNDRCKLTFKQIARLLEGKSVTVDV